MQANHNFVLHLNAFIAGTHIKAEIRKRLVTAIYEYFQTFIQQYPRMEETHLSTNVDKLLITQTSVSDAIHHLNNSCNKLFEWFKEALSRCETITNDLSLCKLIAILAGVLKRLLENFTKTERQLSLSSNGDTECWSMLQYAMNLMQILAEFQNNLLNFEKILLERLKTLENNLKSNEDAPNNALNIYQTYEKSERHKLYNAINEYRLKDSNEESSSNIFKQIYDSLRGHFVEVHEVALNILLHKITIYLQNIQQPIDTLVHSQSLPEFSFTPQEYITQIGQYLLTLPQHLEPLLLSPTPLLKTALEICNIKYAQTEQNSCSADVMLSLIVEQCCLLYQNQILQLKTISNAGAYQLSVDITYLGSVVEELGLTLNTHLMQINTLMKASAENYLNASIGCEPRLVAAIRQMRNIISTQ